MANGSSKSFWGAVTFGAGLAVGVMLVNGVVNMARRFTGLPPGEFTL